MWKHMATRVKGCCKRCLVDWRTTLYTCLPPARGSIQVVTYYLPSVILCRMDRTNNPKMVLIHPENRIRMQLCPPQGLSSESQNQCTSVPVSTASVVNRTDEASEIQDPAVATWMAGRTGAILETSGSFEKSGGAALTAPGQLSRRQRKRRNRANWHGTPSIPIEQVKRVRIPDTLSQTARAPTKKLRTDSVPGSYSQAVSGIKMAVVKSPSSYGRLTAEDVVMIHQEIDNAIDEIPLDGEGPQINTSGLLGGALIINCANEVAIKWLTQFFSGSKWAALGVEFLPASKLPKPVKIAFKTRDVYTQDSDKMLRRLALLNPGLSTDEWRTCDKSVSESCVRWIFEVDQESANYIKSKNLELFAGSHGKGLVKILHDPQAQKTSKPPAAPLTSTFVKEAADGEIPIKTSAEAAIKLPPNMTLESTVEGIEAEALESFH